jgi:hypothetical protein
MAAGLAIGSLGSGCSTSAVSNQSVSVCYRAIPAGRAALHDPQATLVGVHRVPADRVRPHLPPEAQGELGSGNHVAVCAMTFKGTFAPGQVTGAPADEHGDYALVLVSAKRLQLLAAAVLDHPPRGFGGRTL